MNSVAPSAVLFPGQRLPLTSLENLANQKFNEPVLSLSEHSFSLKKPKKLRTNAETNTAAQSHFLAKQREILPNVIYHAPRDVSILTLSFCSRQTLEILRVTAKIFDVLTREALKRQWVNQKIFTLWTQAARNELNAVTRFVRCSEADLFAQMMGIRKLMLADSLYGLSSIFSQTTFVARQLPYCTSIDLSFSLGIESGHENSSWLVNLLKRCPAVTTLKIKRCTLVDFAAIASSCTTLTKLDCSDISGI